MPTVKAKTKSGLVHDFVFDEIVSIDGRPYEHNEPLTERVAYLEGRIAAIENIFTRQEELGAGDGATSITQGAD